MAKRGSNTAGKHQLDAYEVLNYPILLYRRQDSGNVWQYRIWVKEQHKYIRSSSRTENRDEAEKLAIKRFIETGIKKEQNIPIFNKAFGDLAREWIAGRTREYKAGGITKVRLEKDTAKVIRFLIPFFDKKTVSSINQKTIDDFWDWRISYWTDPNNLKTVKQTPHTNKKPAAATLRVEKCFLKYIFKMAVDKGFIAQNKIPNLDPPIKNKATKRDELTPAV